MTFFAVIRSRRCMPALLATLLFAGCATTPPAPVEDRSVGAPRVRAPETRPAAPVARGSYRVQRGDTLYSIAFRNGLDYRELARLNRIAPPYTIFVGQDIRLGAAPAPRGPVAATKPPVTSPATPQRPPVASAPSSGGFTDVPPVSAVTPPPVSATPPRTSAPAAVAPVPLAAAPPASSPAPPAPPPPSSSSVAPSGAAVGGWRWPADGARIAGYVTGDPTRQGIDIAGKSGDPIRAAADGEVVYSGNGLIGYGELIIVKHSPALLSAYGHNRRRLVQEGDKVKSGQQIAEMGSSSASRDMLHFEIRKNGKPVDPAAFLPAR
jgi:lipoprotein NlpD